jgi:putative endonuclease
MVPGSFVSSRASRSVSVGDEGSTRSDSARGTAVKNYWVYIMSGRTRTLYVGVTNDIARRAYETRTSLSQALLSKYHLDRLVYFEEQPDIRDAIDREKQIKSWRREKKVVLIESLNPGWKDLSLDWGLNQGPGVPN